MTDAGGPLDGGSVGPARGIWSRNPLVLAIALSVATALLIGISYHATREAKASAAVLLERRVAEQLALLSLGITQDMRGAHATVLVPVTPKLLVLDPPYDLAEAFARGFARFPYPEFYFTWRSSKDTDGITYIFTRTERPPPWHNPSRSGWLYPVDVARDPAPVRDMVQQVRREARNHRSGALLGVTMAGVEYQVIANFLYHDDESRDVSGIAGMAVNLQWVRESYFDELASQIASIGGGQREVSLEVLDEHRQTVATTLVSHPDGVSAERQFPLAFVDRALLGVFRLDGSKIPVWTARVGIAPRDGMPLLWRSIEGTFLLASLAAAATVAGLIVTMRGVKMSAELTAMKTDFVSSVTHELKTPLAVIGLIADTLARGRYESRKTVREYAGLLSAEVRNLGGLVDNLLAYARMSEGAGAYTIEPVDVAELLEGALQRFRTLLCEQYFAVQKEWQPDLPSVLADRSALVQAVDNVIDNAIKYSDQVRVLAISAGVAGEQVWIDIADRGIGIPENEVPRVSEKFFRGRDAKRGGSGLGLAIVRQILDAQGGSLHITSKVGYGTRVRLLLPRAAA